MAGKDRIGALYYEVILDPKGYAKGAASVKKEEDLLVRAVKSTVSKYEQVEAELKAVIDASLKAEGEKRDLLRRYAKDLIVQKKKMLADDQAALDAADAADKKRTQDKLDREKAALEKTARWRRKLIENSKRMAEKYHADEMQRLRDIRHQRQRNRDGLKHQLDIMHRYVRSQKLSWRSWTDIKKSLQTLPTVFKSILGQVGKVNGGLSKFAGNLTQAMGLSPKMQGLVRAFGVLGAKVLITTLVVVGFVKAMWEAAKIADKWKKQEIQLTAVMKGRSNLAKHLEMDLRHLASTTAFSADQLMEMAIGLKTAGVATDDVRGIAETIGALGGGDKEKMKFIQKAWLDVLGKGKLMGQEALQLANQGVPIYRALAGSMGISQVEARKMAASGKITADEFKRAMEYQAEQVGGIAAMEKGMWTISGQWDQIKKTVWDLFLTIGEEIQPALVWTMWGLKVIVKLLSWMVKKAIMFGDYLIHPWKPIIDSINWIRARMGYVTEKAEEYADELARARAEAEAIAEAQQKTADALLEKEKDATADPEDKKRRDHRRELNKLIIEGKITKEQAMRIVRERGWQERKMQMEKDRLALIETKAKDDEARANRKLKRDAEAAAKAKADAEKLEELRADAYEAAEDRRQADVEAAEDAFNQQVEAIEQRLDDKIGNREQADSASGATFEAGSAEEHQFLREMEMQARRDKMLEAWETKADAERQQANAHLLAMKNNIDSMANNDKRRIAAADDLSDFGYP